MKKSTDTERRIQELERRAEKHVEIILKLIRRIEALEKPRALTKQEILDAGGVISLGKNGL